MPSSAGCCALWTPQPDLKHFWLQKIDSMLSLRHTGHLRFDSVSAPHVGAAQTAIMWSFVGESDMFEKTHLHTVDGARVCLSQFAAVQSQTELK